jgi:hypothetical protein
MFKAQLKHRTFNMRRWILETSLTGGPFSCVPSRHRHLFAQVHILNRVEDGHAVFHGPLERFTT